MLPDMDLFAYAPHPEFDKTASADLGEDTNQWPRKVLVEMYRTLPEASQYAPQVQFFRIDEEQGFALGSVVLSGGTDSAMAATPPESRAKNSVLLPIIVKAHVMFPLDVMIVSGKMMAANGERLREALFRPQSMDLLTDDWGDTSLMGFFSLPGRSDVSPNSGFVPTTDATSTIYGPGMKMSADAFASERYEMLSAIGPTVLPSDHNKLAALAENTEIYQRMVENPAYTHGLRVIAQTARELDVEAMLKTASAAAGIDVVQISYHPEANKYFVKSASRQAYYLNTVMMDRKELLKFAGEEVAKKVDVEGTVTFASPVKAAAAQDTTDWDVVTAPGLYRVRTLEGKEITGWVLSPLTDLDGVTVPMAVFTNGSEAAVQDQIAGVPAGLGLSLPSVVPKGTGVFYTRSEQHGVQCTVPVLVTGSSKDVEGNDAFMVRSMVGGEYTVRLVAGLKRLVAGEGNDVFLPAEGSGFLAVSEETPTVLVRSPVELSKTASALERPTITLRSNGGRCSLELHQLPKLASLCGDTIELDEDYAAMILCLAGLGAKDAMAKVAEASYHRTTADGLTDIRTAVELYDEAREKAASSSKEVLALRRNLTKEASVLPDVQTVDAVLSLDLLNSENVRVYVAKLPYLEKALGMVCHLLLASRLGLSEVPEAPTARCVRGLDEVCRGLRDLGLRETTEEKPT